MDLIRASPPAGPPGRRLEPPPVGGSHHATTDDGRTGRRRAARNDDLPGPAGPTEPPREPMIETTDIVGGGAETPVTDGTDLGTTVDRARRPTSAADDVDSVDADRADARAGGEA